MLLEFSLEKLDPNCKYFQTFNNTQPALEKQVKIGEKEILKARNEPAIILREKK